VTIDFVAPLGIAALGALLAGFAPGRLRPRPAALSLTVAMVAVAATWVWLLLAVTLGVASRIPVVGRLSEWCPDLHAVDGAVAAAAGAGAALVLAGTAVRAVRVARAEHRTRRRMPDCDGGVLVIESDEPTAYAVPGPGGGVVVTTAMMEALAPAEQEVLWAHERSHLVHHHHRYLMAAELAVAVVPLLRPLAHQLRFATERWADEDAARQLGDDRRLVARAIARAALASTDHHRLAMTMAMADVGVGARVQALVCAEHRHLAPAGAVAATLVVATTLGGSTVQLHHLVGFVGHLCTAG
jgi:Zn-dependent protease with chaperone function